MGLFDSFSFNNAAEAFWKQYWSKNFYPEFYTQTTTYFDGDVYEDLDLHEEITKAKEEFGITKDLTVITIKVKKPNVLVAIEDASNKIDPVSYGLARCSPNDAFNMSKGIKLAIHRAVKRLSTCSQ